MKSLVLKDLYNIVHNAKSMLFMLLFFAFLFIPSLGAESYIITSGVMCSMMVVTTFAFDDSSKWTPYAMIMPVSKKDLVLSKFIGLVIFCAVGAIIGLILGIVGEFILQKSVLNAERMITLCGTALMGIIVAEVFGSMSIPLVFKFGSEKGRMLILCSYAVPALICFLVYQLLLMLNIAITDRFILILMWSSPLIAFIWNYIMYKVSYYIFLKQEF